MLVVSDKSRYISLLMHNFRSEVGIVPHSGVVDGGWVSQRDGGCVSQRNGRHISQWGGVGTILPMKNINKLYHLVFCLKCPCI